MATHTPLAPKPARRKLANKAPGKRCSCGNLCRDDHYICSLCFINKHKKHRKIKTNHHGEE